MNYLFSGLTISARYINVSLHYLIQTYFTALVGFSQNTGPKKPGGEGEKVSSWHPIFGSEGWWWWWLRWGEYNELSQIFFLTVIILTRSWPNPVRPLNKITNSSGHLRQWDYVQIICYFLIYREKPWAFYHSQRYHHYQDYRDWTMESVGDEMGW